ncbi:hypothetical protein NM688_g8220 [Phlebia brevispora]|uniref:Uncharacterized protein n=1 Tax=Phlebia brevispora TaxID=194682 RepID=A0ACC1RVT0_9APHY|nr:hypothetical protein NM688_g8220 [Phlebia brevispora]
MSSAVFSPAHENETFSTPPTTPTTIDNNILDRPSLSRRSSRPSNLRITQNATDWTSGIQVVADNLHASADGPLSSDHTMSNKVPTPSTAVPYTNGAHPNATVSSPLAPGPNMTHSAGKSPRPHPPLQRQASPMRSPCFVHSKLQGPSFGEWLREKQHKAFDDTSINRVDGVDVNPIGISYPDGTLSDADDIQKFHHWRDDDDDEEETAGTLTKQLAETAVGVREMSKQLGRTRVRSSIQSILIVTKARDNRLIQLTRELALYLMLKPQKGGRGMIVYVDAQLKTSRRFDAAGIERDHPELFVPVPRRRSSSSSSLASMASNGCDSNEEPEEHHSSTLNMTP